MAIQELRKTSNAAHDWKATLHKMISEQALLIAETSNELIVKRNGREAKWLFDIRQVLLNPVGLQIFANIFWEIYEGELPFQVGGIEFSATPMVSAIQLEALKRGHKINGFIVRKERKDTGRCRLYEGNLTDEPIIIVDDILNSGTTIKKVYAVLASYGRKIDKLFSIVNFGRCVEEDFKSIHMRHLFSLDDFETISLAPTLPEIKNDLSMNWVFVPEKPNYTFNVPRSNPLLYKDRIYFGSSDSCFYCLEQETKKLIWKFTTPRLPKGILSSPAKVQDKIIFGAYTGSVYAVNMDDGSLLWENFDSDFIGSSPAIAEDLGLVFIGAEYAVPNQKGALIALSLETGKQIWWQPLKQFLHGSPIYIPKYKTVAVGTNDRTVIYCNAQTGEKLWSFDAGGEVKASLIFDEENDQIIFGSFDGCIYALNIHNGKKNWSYQTQAPIYTTPHKYQDHIFCPSLDKHIHILKSSNGCLVKTHKTNGRLYGTPASHNGVIWFGGNDGTLNGIANETLEICSRIKVSERLLTKPVFNNNKIFIAGAGGTLFSITKKSE